MSCAELLREVESVGAKVRAVGDTLEVAPASALSPSLVERLRRHKPELLAMLSREVFPPTNALERARERWGPDVRIIPAVTAPTGISARLAFEQSESLRRWNTQVYADAAARRSKDGGAA